MQLPNRHTIVIVIGALFFALLPIAANLTDQPYLLSLFSRILIYAIAAVSLDLLIGFGGLVSLGHAAYVGIGAYVVGIFYQHGFEAEPLLTWPFLIQGTDNALIVFPAAVIIAGIFALIFGALSLRTTGMHFIMITLAFAQMLYYFFISLGKYGGDDGLSLYSRVTLPGLDLADDLHFYYLCLIFLALFLVFTVRLSRSRFGLVLRGSKNNDRRLNALGIHSYRYKLACFVLAGAGAGLAGALLANQSEYVSPGLLHWTLSGELMVMVLLGGLGTLYGPVAGATLFLLLEEVLAMYTEHWMVIMGPILILVVIFAKHGVIGWLIGWRK
ncbi:branched-chain amino acid ABC transporter permease [Desulfosediminicola flagellatus]|uniref:branched-chain amino acid ABC transporter permease n=1 Tax=Desulfosediminicola flagellatus TaxID=2569541 RepID=UPI0010AC0B3E|nr:branched-chain amino acid ABC transporter permease [Desulfosediminicola flagellatus]